MSFGYRMMPGGKRLDPDVQAHYRRMTSTDSGLRWAIKNTILDLKGYGVWDKMDVICVVHDNANEADSLLNLKGPIYDATNVNGAIFTPDRGFTITNPGIDTVNASYINTNYAINGGSMTRTSNSLFVYKRVNAGAFTYDIGAGADSNSQVSLFFDSGPTPDETYYYGDIWADSPNSPAILQDLPIGFLGGTRVGNNGAIQSNGTMAANTFSTFATALSSETLFVGDFNGPFGGSPATGNQYSAWGAGAGLSITELANLEATIQAYMTARGIAV